MSMMVDAAARTESILAALERPDDLDDDELDLVARLIRDDEVVPVEHRPVLPILRQLVARWARPTLPVVTEMTMDEIAERLGDPTGPKSGGQSERESLAKMP